MKKVNIEVEKIKIQINSENCLYITIGDWTYYIDDSTNEQITEKWHKNDPEEWILNRKKIGGFYPPFFYPYITTKKDFNELRTDILQPISINKPGEHSKNRIYE